MHNYANYMQSNSRDILLSASFEVLGQLRVLAEQLTPGQYSLPLELLNSNTIGKHYRHIIEFYICLNRQDKAINYDNRKRDNRLENDPVLAVTTIDEIKNFLSGVENIDEQYTYEADFSSDGGAHVVTTTTLGRELAYNIEHAVHHMAIIQIVVQHHFPAVKLEENFGVAASTQRYQQQVSCAQ